MQIAWNGSSDNGLSSFIPTATSIGSGTISAIHHAGSKASIRRLNWSSSFNVVGPGDHSRRRPSTQPSLNAITRHERSVEWLKRSSVIMTANPYWSWRPAPARHAPSLHSLTS